MSWGEVILGLVLLGGYFLFKKGREEVRMDEARQRYEESMTQHWEWETQQMENAIIAGVADDESRGRQREAQERKELQEIYDRVEDPDLDLYMDSLLEDSHDEWDVDLYGDTSDGWNDDIGSDGWNDDIGSDGWSMDYGSAEGGGFWD